MWGLRGESEVWGFWLPCCLFVFVCDHLADSAIRADSSGSVKELLRLRKLQEIRDSQSRFNHPHWFVLD